LRRLANAPVNENQPGRISRDLHLSELCLQKQRYRLPYRSSAFADVDDAMAMATASEAPARSLFLKHAFIIDEEKR
jgi:hypothetical protein